MQVKAGEANQKAAKEAEAAAKLAQENATARSHGFKDAAAEKADNALGFVTDDFSVVSKQKGDYYPITANNLPWQIAPKQAVDNSDNCVVFIWQYIWDTYHVSMPYIVASSTDNSQITKAYPEALRQSPAVGDVVVFGPHGKLYTDQLGTADVSGTGHVMVISGINPDGTFTAMDSGTKLGWGGVETHVRPQADVNYYDFRFSN